MSNIDVVKRNIFNSKGFEQPKAESYSLIGGFILRCSWHIHNFNIKLVTVIGTLSFLWIGEV